MKNYVIKHQKQKKRNKNNYMNNIINGNKHNK
jgi:hypothetical protein